MAVSPDDRFAGLLNASAERGGWVPGDVFTADSAGDEEVVEPRRVRLPVLVAVAIATVGVLVLAFFFFRPAAQHSPTQADGGGPAAGAGQTTNDSQPAGPTTAQVGAGAGTGGPASAAPDGTVTVHVTGAVEEPSVVTLKAGARVQDAVEAAGGLSSGADTESVNLARVLADGEQIHIPEEGEVPAADAAANSAAGQETGGDTTGGAAAGANGAADGSGTASGGTNGGGSTASADGSSSATGAGGKIDLNTADATALETLPGVGPVTAEAIIAHRQTQPFATVDDLLLVKGIGPKTFESLKDLVTVG